MAHDDEYTRISDRARALGFTLHPTEIEGEPAFLVSRWAMSRVLPDLADVDAFLDRAGTSAQTTSATKEGRHTR